MVSSQKTLSDGFRLGTSSSGVLRERFFKGAKYNKKKLHLIVTIERQYHELASSPSWTWISILLFVSRSRDSFITHGCRRHTGQMLPQTHTHTETETQGQTRTCSLLAHCSAFFVVFPQNLCHRGTIQKSMASSLLNLFSLLSKNPDMVLRV